MRPARPRVWPSLLLFPLALVAQFVLSALVLVVWALARGVDLAEIASWSRELQASPGGLLLLVLPTQALYLTLALGAGLLSPSPLRERLSLRLPRRPLASVAWTLVGTLALALALQAASDALLEQPSEQLRILSEAILSARGAQATVLVLALSLAPGLCEELFFRGLLQTRLVQAWGAPRGVLLAGLCFASAHVDPQHAALVLPLGLWFGAVSALTRSLPLAMLAHATSNAFSMLLLRATARPEAPQAALAPGWAALVVLTLLAGLALARGRERAVSSAADRPGPALP